MGMLIGNFELGPVSGFSGGGTFDLARRWGDWAIRGEYDLLGFGDDPQYDPSKPPARHGYAHRFGAGIRRYAEFSDPSHMENFETNAWLEAGVGDQLLDVSWQGRWLERRDVYFSIGMDWGGRHLSRKVKGLDMYYALRVTIARTPADMTDAMCGKPCVTMIGAGGMPPVSQPYDFGIFLDWGVTLGL
jgi:hypothetical protein